MSVRSASLNRWLALLGVALIEFGGGLSFAVSSVLKQGGIGVQSAPIATAEFGRLEEQVSTGVQIIVADNEQEANEIRALHGVQDVSNLGVQKLDVPDAYSGRLLLMLKDKTKGNLTSDEQRFIDSVVGDLQAKFLLEK